MITPNNTSVIVTDNFKTLLGFLTVEPFAVSSGFGDLNLEEIGMLLEEPIEESSQIFESYNSCKSTFCLLLIELELCGHTSIPQQLIEKPLKDLSELAAMSAPPKQRIEEIKLSQIIEERKINLEEEEVTRLTPTLEIVNAKPTPKETDLQQEFDALGHCFIGNTINFPESLSKEVSDRAAIHFLIAASEISLFRRFKEGIATLWPNRLEAIQELLNPNEFKFNETTLTKIKTDEESHPELIVNGAFPRVATLHCLKYLTLTKSLESIHPTIFELGVIIYFWGTEIASKAIENEQDNLFQFSQEQTVELAFRSFRLERLKTSASNFNQPLAENYLQIVLEDVQAINHVLGRNTSFPCIKKVA